jgi:hypothetical protein
VSIDNEITLFLGTALAAKYMSISATFEQKKEVYEPARATGDFSIFMASFRFLYIMKIDVKYVAAARCSYCLGARWKMINDFDIHIAVVKKLCCCSQK